MKREISEAYLRLIKTKDGDKITVKDLFQECGVSRQTFYYHFRDLMDVIEYSLRGILDDVVQECAKMDDPKDAIRHVLNTVIMNRSLIRRLETTSRHKEIEKIVATALHDTMAAILDIHDSDSRHLPKNDRETLLEFFSFGILGFVLSHLDDKNMDVDKLTDQLFRIYSGELKLL